jgi:hypothetical protein
MGSKRGSIAKNREVGNMGKFRIIVTLGMALGFMAAFAAAPLYAKKPGGGGGGSTTALYRVTMTPASPSDGLNTNCDIKGYVLATLDSSGGTHLHTNGTELDPADGQPVDLFLGFFNSAPSNAVAWTRKYDAGRGTSGTFNGCFGQTDANATTGNKGYSGNLFIYFTNTTSGPVVRFIWWFEYYISSTVREHFGLLSGDIPFAAAWTGGNISGQVDGTFDYVYYLKEGHKILSAYQPLPGGSARPLTFTLSIEKVQ